MSRDQAGPVTARLDPAGSLAVCWRDHTDQNRSTTIGSAPVEIDGDQARRRRWATDELRRSGWAITGSSWEFDVTGAEVRPVIRRSRI